MTPSTAYPATDRSPGLGLLRRAILAYRRWCSGRGPLRFVGCSFANAESCSAYGLRMAETAPSVWIAVQRIRARLRRCREASVYVFEDQHGRSLAWGCCHDEPAGLEEELARVGELPQTRYAVIDASRRIAAYRGRWDLAIRLHAQLATLEAELEGTSPRLLVRRGESVLTYRAWRLVAEVAACAVVVGVGFAVVPVLAASLFAAAVGLGVIGLVWRHRRRLQRFDWLLAAAQFARHPRDRSAA